MTLKRSKEKVTLCVSDNGLDLPRGATRKEERKRRVAVAGESFISANPPYHPATDFPPHGGDRQVVSKKLNSLRWTVAGGLVWRNNGRQEGNEAGPASFCPLSVRLPDGQRANTGG